MDMKSRLLNNRFTRLKPVGHGYVFSMAVGTIGVLLKLIPFFLLWDEELILMGGGQFLKINILAFKHIKMKYLALVLRKRNK